MRCRNTVTTETLESYLDSLKSIDGTGKRDHLAAAVEALGQVENDLDALDCLSQIISTANKISRHIIVKMFQEEKC